MMAPLLWCIPSRMPKARSCLICERPRAGHSLVLCLRCLKAYEAYDQLLGFDHDSLIEWVAQRTRKATRRQVKREAKLGT